MPPETLGLPSDPATASALSAPAAGTTLGANGASPQAPPAAVDDPPGYALRAEIGRGGMGVVYRARDVAFDREVAVKVLQARYAPDSGTARRFVDEARITGQLQHPGIPAVYQVGSLSDGRAFLAMKLIRGRTLDELLKAGAAVDPLAVVEAVGQAVGYAHAHGVIHRDLKPANVMVGAFGEVQVMDWGLAKVLANGEHPSPESPADPDATAAPTEIRSLRGPDGDFTQAGCILGTPAYMPPEQAAGELAKVDARSDVFGVGAILCVLLTGQPPFDGTNPESVRVNAVRGKTEAAFARLDACTADPDVVALCKRSLAFDPADRPATADMVASDVTALRRAADDRARQAERDKLSAEVRAAEQAKRRRSLQRAAGAVAAVLLLGVAGTTVGAVRADAARRAAETAERAAEQKQGEAEAAREAEAAQTGVAKQNEAAANAVVGFFEDHVFVAARPEGQAGGLGKDVTLRNAVAAGLPALATKFAQQPLVEARLRATLGLTLFYLGDIKTAAEQYELAHKIYTDRLGPDHLDTLGSMTNLAISYAIQGRHDAARKLQEDLLARQKRVLPPDDPMTLGSMSFLANCYAEMSRHADALKLYEEVLAGRRRVLGPDHPDTLTEMWNVAFSYAALGRHADALKLHEEVLAGRRRALPPDHAETLTSTWSVVHSLIKRNRGAEAVPLIDKCVALGAGNPLDIRAAIDLRLQHFQGANDSAGCRATAAMWEKLDRPDAADLYIAARLRAVAAAVYTKSNQPDEASADAVWAMAWLAKAVAAGYTDGAHMRQDADLAFLRGRADFRRLVGPLTPEPAPAPRPVR